MPPKAASSAGANSGIRKLDTGESVIPSSTRPDGSVRKAIRVKPGYKPPEDVEVYKNRTTQAWKDRGKAGVPGAQTVFPDDYVPPHKLAALKNIKRKEARKKAAEAAAEGQAVEEEVPSAPSLERYKWTDRARTNGTADAEKVDEVDPEAEKAKEARKLAKKLRQARELQEKKEGGEGLLPEQLAKVIKMHELIRQLDGLGFDNEGEKKDSKPVDDTGKKDSEPGDDMGKKGSRSVDDTGKKDSESADDMG